MFYGNNDSDILNVKSILDRQTRKLCSHKETVRCWSYSLRFKVRQQHPL